MSKVEELALLRFIPFRRSDITAMCLSGDELQEQDREFFLQAAQQIERHFLQEFHQLKNRAKDAYAHLDPDTDINLMSVLGAEENPVDLQEILEQLLERANYEKVTQKDLQRAFKSSSLFQVRLYVDLNDFEEALLYTRGASKREETLKEFFGLWRRKVRFTNYDRVVLYIRFKDDIDSESALGVCPPGSTMLKLFQNVPEADLEILFPNIRVGMRMLDKLMIGVPALVSGGLVLSTKMGATLLLLGSLLGFWLGVHSEPVQFDKAALLAVIAGVGAFAGYLWKQLSNFRNRKLKYTQTLTENLYFKLLDNNAGVLLRVLDDAQESECKESLLALYFLLAEGKPMTAVELDKVIETWFAERWHSRLNFEIDDALDKLHKLNLVKIEGEQWSVVT